MLDAAGDPWGRLRVWGLGLKVQGFELGVLEFRDPGCPRFVWRYTVKHIGQTAKKAVEAPPYAYFTTSHEALTSQYRLWLSTGEALLVSYDPYMPPLQCRHALTASPTKPAYRPDCLKAAHALRWPRLHEC